MRGHRCVKKPIRQSARSPGAQIRSRVSQSLQRPYRLVSHSLCRWESSVTGRTSARMSLLAAKPARRAMHLTSLHYLFLIPLGLALAFLLWVLWSVTRQLAKGGSAPEKQPTTISVRVRDRYTLDVPTTPARTAQVGPPVVRGHESSVAHGPSAPREFSRVLSPPTLGMGFRPASSSAGRASRR